MNVTKGAKELEYALATARAQLEKQSLVITCLRGWIAQYQALLQRQGIADAVADPVTDADEGAVLQADAGHSDASQLSLT